MVRNRLAKMAAFALLLGFLALVEPGVAWAAPVAVGTASCPIIAGAGTLSPGLTAAGSPGGVKITFHATLGPTPLSGCASSVHLVTGAPVTITGGTLKGAGFYNGPAGSSGNSCANFDGPDILGKIVATVKWAAVPAIAPSKVVYKGGTPSVSGAPTDTISLPALGGITVKSGSLTSPALPHDIKLVTDIPSTCAATSAPVTTFTISGGNVSL
jgi:hypothetical protein